MATLKAITRGVAVKGILPEGMVTISNVCWIGTVAIEARYKDTSGRHGNELLCRDRELVKSGAQGGGPQTLRTDLGSFGTHAN